MVIADTFNLDLSTPTNPGPTRFADNPLNSNSVLDLIFINSHNRGFNNHTIMENKRYPLDYVPLHVKVQINIVDMIIYKN